MFGQRSMAVVVGVWLPELVIRHWPILVDEAVVVRFLLGWLMLVLVDALQFFKV